MQCCQHCGAKSWASAEEKDWNELTDDGWSLPAEGTASLLICDGCNSWGLKSVIEQARAPQTKEELNRLFGSFAPPADPVANAMRLLSRMIPTPETRLERLVKVLIGSKICGAGDYAQSVVKIARTIETEIDREQLMAAAPQQPSEPDADFTDGPSDDIGVR